MTPPFPTLESWSDWSEWTRCDALGAQSRVRHCDVLFPTGNQCSGNSSETRPCPPDSNFIPGGSACCYDWPPRRPYRTADKQGSPPIDRLVTRDTPGSSIATAARGIIRPSSLSLVSLLPPHRRLSRQIEQMHYSDTLQYHLHSQTLGE